MCMFAALLKIPLIGRLTSHQHDGKGVRIGLIPQTTSSKYGGQGCFSIQKNPADLILDQQLKHTLNVDQTRGFKIPTQKSIAKWQISAVNKRWDADKNEIASKI